MAVPPSRAQVLAAVAAQIPKLDRPLLVAIDGVDGSGKTTFADELGALLIEQGRVVVRAGIDSFHLPRAIRHGRGRSPESVWSRHFDYRALRRELLDPWLTGDREFRSSWHDVVTDEYQDVAPRPVPTSGILLVDGVFAQRAELRNAWDLTVFLDAPFEVTVPRMAARDGTVSDVDDPDQQRYIGAQRLYFEHCSPRDLADIVIDNADWAAPIIVEPPDGPLAPGWRREGDHLVREVHVRHDVPKVWERLAEIDRLAGD